VALRDYGFLSAIAAPTMKVEEILSWKPDLALFDFDLVEKRSMIKLVTGLGEAEIPLIAIGRPNRIDWMREEPIRDAVSAVVDRTSALTDLVSILCRLLRHDFSGRPNIRRNKTEHERDLGDHTPQSRILAVLTTRERQILLELIRGHRAADIAIKDCVSISTVRSQIKSILQKFGVDSQMAAVALAERTASHRTN